MNRPAPRRHCRKRRFRDHKEAVAALQQAANARAQAEWAQSRSRRREIRAYDCPRCRGIHLTSQRHPGQG